MVIIVALVVVIMLLVFSMIYLKYNSCGTKGESKYDGKFNYDVSYSAPRISPVAVLNVDFISDSGTMTAAFGRKTCHSGMGTGLNPVAGLKENKYFLPKAFEATWTSLVDRKAYHIAVLLPYDDIVSLFKEDNGLLNSLDMCFMPEGRIMLYVKGGGRMVLLDWSAYGVEEKDDDVLKYFYMPMRCKNMEEYFDLYYSGEFEGYKSFLSYNRANGSPVSLLNRYLQRFNYELNFEFEDTTTHNFTIWAPYTNQERYPATADLKGKFQMSARIQELKAYWDTKDFHYTCFMYFNEEEVLRVFDEAYGEDRMQEGELTIKVCKYNNLFDISLNVGDKSVKLEKTEIRVFQDPIDDPDGDGTLIYKNYEGNHRNLFIDDEEYFQE